MASSYFLTNRLEHPLDIVEQLAYHQEWHFDRGQEDEISLSVVGKGATYNISFTWLPLVEALHLACTFEVNMPSQRQSTLSTLLSLINEQLWIGHFGRGGPGLIVFRHSLILSGGISPSVSQCECLLKAAVNSCERYYQAFQIILWSEESAQNALHWTTIETQGEA